MDIIEYTDSHCHLDALKDANGNHDPGRAIAAAHERGVKNILSVCTRLQDIDTIKTIVKDHENIWMSVGIHPLELESGVASVDELVQLVTCDKIVAIGETGLDFYYSKDTQKVQMDAFAQHLEAGKQSQLPVIVHTRSARQETMELIQAHASRESAGVMHCFTEDITMAKQALDLGFYISLSGIVTFKNAESLREVARYVPEDRLLIETDSPYLAPVPHRGKPNQPAFVIEVGDFIASLRGVENSVLAAITTRNFFNLFKKAAEL